MVDTHCHLDACEPPDGELVDRAREAGVTRIATVGTDARLDRSARSRRRAHHDEVAAIVGRHPHETAGFDTGALEEIERRPADPGARAIGETGLDYYRDHAPREDQRRAFAAQLELAARLGLPVVIHTRAAEEDTFALLREHAAGMPAVILHCFSAPDRVDECVERGYLCSFAGNVTYPKATDLQEAARESRPSCCWSRPTPPTSRRSPCGAAPTSRPTSCTQRDHVAGLRGVSYEELEQAVEANAARVFGW